MLSNSSTLVEKSFVSRRLQHSWDLLRELVSRDMKVRYKRSAIGTIWSILNPLAQLVVLNFVFSTILPTRVPNFVSFLLTGVLVWSWFSSGLNAGTAAIVNNGILIRKPGFPVAILPVVSITTQMVHFALALPILAVFIVLSGLSFSPTILLLPIVMAIQFVLMLSLVYTLAAVNVNFRDTKYLLEIFLMLGFYLSPIFYQVKTIPPHLLPIYNLNPMVHIISAYRYILLWGEIPPLLPLAILTVVSFVVLAFSYRIFKRASYKFVEEL